MYVRFDNSQEWMTSGGLIIPIKEMETTHLMNTIRMFIKKPFVTASMIVRDIENNAVCPVSSGAWTGECSTNKDVKKESIHNVTSMSDQDLIAYALNSTLGQAMLAELTDRGVNVENLINMTLGEDGDIE